MHKMDDMKGLQVPRNSKVEHYFMKHSRRPDEIKLEPQKSLKWWTKKLKFPIPVKH